MRIKVTWQTATRFIDLESGDQMFVEAFKLEDALDKMFRHIIQVTCKTADHEDEVPLTLTVKADLECFDQQGNHVEDRTPRGLYELMSDQQRDALKTPRKKKGANNGKS